MQIITGFCRFIPTVQAEKQAIQRRQGVALFLLAKKDGVTLVCVTLNDRNDWNDHISLYDYAFEKYRGVDCKDADFCADIPCVGGDKDSVTVTGEKNNTIVFKA